jgi:hypothetical protein
MWCKPPMSIPEPRWRTFRWRSVSFPGVETAIADFRKIKPALAIPVQAFR